MNKRKLKTKLRTFIEEPTGRFIREEQFPQVTLLAPYEQREDSTKRKEEIIAAGKNPSSRQRARARERVKVQLGRKHAQVNRGVNKFTAGKVYYRTGLYASVPVRAESGGPVWTKEVIINRRQQPSTSHVVTNNPSTMPALRSSKLFRHGITLVNPHNILAKSKTPFHC